MPEILIQDLTRHQQLTLRINGKNPSFRLSTEAIEAAAVQALDARSLDFLEIAASVFHADGEIGRGGETRSDFGRGWHRNLRLTIPVRMLEFWCRADVSSALTETVKFLTDDTIEFHFIHRQQPETSTSFLSLDPKGAAFAADEVILFSGGLDSFAGALEALSTGTGKVLLVSHRSAQKVHARQDSLAAWLSKRFAGRIRHVRVAATRVGNESHETTQRSRSLLFAAIGHAVALSFGTKRLSFYENGIVSHNLPISPQVVGTMATRTTHPHSIALLNQLLALIAPESTRISNGYQWLTKTEVVERIARHNGVEMIGTAVSCTRVRDQTRLHTHCGRCSQCLDRRFAILAAGLEARDRAESYATDVFMGGRTDAQSRTLAVEWTRHAIRLHEIEDREFAVAFGTEVSRVLNGFPIEERSAAFNQVVEMHRRHGSIVRKVLTETISDKSPEIATQRLDPSCLIKLWIGSGSDSDLHVAATETLSASTDAAGLVETDDMPSPDGPWSATFFTEKGGPAVSVKGLGLIRGKPAMVTHLLKDVFLEDQTNGLAKTDYRHVLIYRLPGTDINIDAAKQNVRRCRNSLELAYKSIFGTTPSKPLLIEGAGKKGHRLDPMTTVIIRT